MMNCVVSRRKYFNFGEMKKLLRLKLLWDANAKESDGDGMLRKNDILLASRMCVGIPGTPVRGDLRI